MSVEPAVVSDRSSCPTCLAVFRGGFLRCPRDGALLSSEDRDPLVGRVLADRYIVENVIGEGGIGRVYAARHVRMSRRYAIKVPFGELAYDTKVRARFLHEAEATSRLHHPGVIGVVDVGETEQGLLYIAMDLAEGESLSEVIARDGPMPRARVLAILAQVADGLAHAHERGLIHRDLKPENLILDAAGGAERVRIVDFGIALLRDEGGDGGRAANTPGRLTTEGIVLGTPHYMAPEQACNQPIDHRTDLFALGLITYEMLAGVLPFEGTPIEVARKNLGAEVPRISARVPALHVDPLLEALAFWMLRKRPEDRPQRAAEVAELARLIERDPAAAAARLQVGGLEEIEETGLAPREAVPRPPRAPAPPPRAEVLPPDADHLPTDRVEDARRRTLWIAAAVAVLVALGLVVVLTRGGGAPAAPPDAGGVAAAPPLDAAPELPVAADPEPPATDPMPDPDPDDAGGVDEAAPDPAPDPGKRPGTGRRTGPGTGKQAGGDAARPGAGETGGAGGAGGGVAAVTDPTPPPGDEPPSEKSLTALYQQVGQLLDRKIKANGAAATLDLRRRYEAIPYLDAVRKPALRADAITRLRALSRELAALP